MIAFPFNHQPDSVSIKTSSYTIPSGKYARVTVTDFTSDFTIDSVVAIEQCEFQGTIGSGAGAIRFTNTTNYALKGHFWLESTGFLYVNQKSLPTATVAALILKHTYTGNSMTLTSQGSREIILYPDDVIYGAASSSDGGYSLRSENEPAQTEFWVPSGTDLDGSRYIVELYNELT